MLCQPKPALNTKKAQVKRVWPHWKGLLQKFKSNSSEDFSQKENKQQNLYTFFKKKVQPKILNVPSNEGI